MSSTKQVENIILGSLASNLTSINANWTYRYNVDSSLQNKDFDPDKSLGTNGKEWCQPVIKFGDSEPGEKGEGGIGIRHGIFMLRFFVEVDTGKNTIATYASIAESIFGTKILEDSNGHRVVFGQASSGAKGAVDRGFYEYRMDVGFNSFTGENE